MRKEVPKYEIIIPSNRKHNYVLNNRNLSFYLLFISSLVIISYVIYLCSYYDNNHSRLHTKYGPIARIKQNDLIDVSLWNTERDDNSDDNKNEIIGTTEKFDMTSDDVMVFLHIQNTGGNVFVRHIVEDLIIDSPCNCNLNHRKRCQCLRPNRPHSQWLFSETFVLFTINCNLKNILTSIISYCRSINCWNQMWNSSRL